MTQEVTIQLSDQQVKELSRRAQIENTSLKELITRIIENDILDSINSVSSAGIEEESNSLLTLNHEIAANEAISTEAQRRHALSKENEVKFSQHDGSEGRPNP
ncbi:hypothetical protein ACWV26_18900 [Rummeliibacillus sp. JY-2-4R]